MKRLLTVCLVLLGLFIAIPVQASDDDFHVDWSFSEQGAGDRLSFWLGEDQQGDLKESSSEIFGEGALTLQANEEQPWEEGAGIVIKMESGMYAWGRYITIEGAVTEGAPTTWKLQVSRDRGQTYTDIEGAVTSIQKYGKIEVLFDNIELPYPSDDLSYNLEHRTDYDPEQDPYQVRMVAVSDDGTDMWIGGTTGELYVKDVYRKHLDIIIDDQIVEEIDQTNKETESEEQQDERKETEQQVQSGQQKETENQDKQTTVVHKDIATRILVKQKIILKVGKQKQLKVTVKNRNGKKVTFRSKNPKIVKVNKKGLVTAKKKGKARVVVKCNGKKKTVTIQVK